MVRGRDILAAALFSSFVLSFSVRAGDWPQWLGPSRNGHAASGEKALEKLNPDLRPVWKIAIGGGFSSPVVAQEKLLYFDEDGAQETAHLLDAGTGREIWKTTIAARYSDEWGSGPRSTPLVDGDRVYVQSCMGEFRCLNFADGKTVWGCSFEKDFGVKFLGSKAQEGTAARRGNNGSGVIDGKFLILPVGSTNGATLVAFDKVTGKIQWKTGKDEAAYSSPVMATLAGVRQVVYLSADGLMGVELEKGELLWSVPLKTNAKRHAATPVIYGDNVIVNSHTFGLLDFKISKTGNDWQANQTWVNKSLKINLSTPVLAGDYLFSQGPNRNFICADLKSGTQKWELPGFGKDNSSTILVGDKLIVLVDDGQLVLMQASGTKPEELGRMQICGRNWNFPAYSNGKLYVRDARELLCYDLKN